MENGQPDGGNGHIQYQENPILPTMTRVNTVQKINEDLFGSFQELMVNQ
jgi:hypothetical protein